MLVYHSELDVSVMVHGDDFVAVGPDKHLDNIKNTLSENCKIKIEQLGMAMGRDQDSQQSCMHEQCRH